MILVLNTCKNLILVCNCFQTYSFKERKNSETLGISYVEVLRNILLLLHRKCCSYAKASAKHSVDLSLF